jgi:uncharacterized membrane protein
MVGSAAIRHFMNIRFTYNRWLPAAAGTAIVALMAASILMARPQNAATAATSGPVPFAAAREVIDRRCLPCHSATPTDDVFTVAPGAVTFDSPDEIKRQADRIMARAVVSKTMPLGNKTGMTEDERALLGRWIEEGASVDEQGSTP